MFKDKAGLAAGLIIGSSFGMAGIGAMTRYSDRTIPSDEKVELGYVIPDKLEIKCKDYNGDGINETKITYDGKDYLFILDSLNRPKINYDARID